jgi:type VI secretion system secreted protein Hcp
MAVDYFLKFGGVQGEVADLMHKKEIHLLSWGWQAHNLSSVANGGGSGAGKVSLEDFTCTTYLDRSTGPLFKHIWLGAHVSSAIFSARKAGGQSYGPWLTLTFNNVFITTLTTVSDIHNPGVTLSFSFEQVTFEYKTQRADGTLISTGPVTYNRKENKLS